MKNERQQAMYSVLRQTWMEMRAAARKALGMLQKTPLPRVLVFVLGLAILFAIVPLMLTLFVVFMLVKLLFLLIVVNGQRQPAEMPARTSTWRNQDFEDVEVIEVPKSPDTRR